MDGAGGCDVSDGCVGARKLCDIEKPSLAMATKPLPAGHEPIRLGSTLTDHDAEVPLTASGLSATATG